MIFLALIFPWELGLLGSATTFFIYTVFALIGLGFIVVLMPEIGEAQAEAVAMRIRDKLEAALTGKVSLSVGVAVLGPDTDAEALIRSADVAMYDAKKAGGARVVVRRPG